MRKQHKLNKMIKEIKKEDFLTDCTILSLKEVAEKYQISKFLAKKLATENGVKVCDGRRLAKKITLV